MLMAVQSSDLAFFKTKRRLRQGRSCRGKRALEGQSFQTSNPVDFRIYFVLFSNKKNFSVKQTLKLSLKLQNE